jgi:hypothetical protein
MDCVKHKHRYKCALEGREVRKFLSNMKREGEGCDCMPSTTAKPWVHESEAWIAHVGLDWEALKREQAAASEMRKALLYHVASVSDDDVHQS